MTYSILDWEAVNQIQEALIDRVSDEQLQKILDVIYGKGFFTIIDAETLKKNLFEDKEIMSYVNSSKE